MEQNLTTSQATSQPDGAAPAGVLSRRFEKWTDQGNTLVDGGIVIEEPLEVRVDGRAVAVLMRTPGLEKELATGFCLGEGLVSNLMHIALVRHCGRAVPDELVEGDPLDESRNRVDVMRMPSAAQPVNQPEVARLIRSGCGRADVNVLAETLAPLQPGVQVPFETLLPLQGQITRQQAAYRVAGGIHAAGVFDTSGRCLVVCEDVGRHNAVDKVAGYCLLRGIPLGDKLLVSTGRASYDMVAKGVRLGVQVLVSISSPTSLAVELAELLNCTLVGYLRGKALNVYTHSWRILPPRKANPRTELGTANSP